VDLPEAAKWYELAATAGLTRAMLKTGLAYALGLGVAPDPEKAVAWWKTAWERDEPEAGYHFARAHERRYGGAGKYEALKGDHLRKEYPILMDILSGNMFYSYKIYFFTINRILYLCANNSDYLDVEYNSCGAMKRAATSGHSEASYSLAQSERDPKEAARLWSDAGWAGHVKAQERMGWAFDQGYGVAIDESRAFDWFLKAARQGSAVGQYKVGLALMRGYGIQADPPTGLKWSSWLPDKNCP
jgi:TPR repeat protein